MAQTSGFDPTTQVKTCFDCKMFDVTNWVAYLNREDGPGGTPSHEALSVSSQGALEISSVAGQPPSLDRCHFCKPRLVAVSNSLQTPQMPRTHSVEMCALLWKIMTWCHRYHITLKARHIPGCLNVMADLLSRSNQVQSTEWSLHPQVFKQNLPEVVHSSCRPVCHSSEPQTPSVLELLSLAISVDRRSPIRCELNSSK